MKTSEAFKIVGGLSGPSKMPCWSYGLPASKCIMGSKLRKLPWSVCHNCYSHKGCYVFPVVKVAQERRLKSLSDPQWVEAMSLIINTRQSKYFRWHDSGDLQGDWHLEKIMEVVRNCPTVKFWLPTKEYGMVAAYRKKHGAFPSNIVVRVSAPMVNQAPRIVGDVKGSMVYTGVLSAVAKRCLAPKQDGKCLKCRRCWNKSVDIVAYRKH